jgi:hypothetical protein
MKHLNRFKANLLQKIILILIFLISFSNSFMETNPYKDANDVHHSLFRERDSIERMSVDPEGVPKPIQE